MMMIRRSRTWLAIVTAATSTVACNGGSAPSIAPRPAMTPVVESAATQEPGLLAPETPPRGASEEFSTDFTRHNVSYREILSGGPPKDGIPAIDRPTFVSTKSAAAWLKPREPVVAVRVDGNARAYPIQILMFHEIVNDVVAGQPLIVTFCPLCNTAISFKSELNGKRLTFGTTGRLRNSNLIMYDRQSETWWQQATGRAIAGRHTGKQLEFYPAQMIAWETFAKANPGGKVLSRDTGFTRSYGRNPYAGYDDVDRPPFLYRGPKTPGVLRPVERVLALELGGNAVAYPYKVLRKRQAINDVVAGTPIAVWWTPGVNSALDEDSIHDGRDVGAAVAYSRRVAGRTLTFVRKGRQFADLETKSRWRVDGRASGGSLKGQRLSPVAAVNHFWFSWAAFNPKTRVFGTP